MIASRVEAVRERIARAAERAGRRPDAVTLVAVSKTFPADAVRGAYAAGLRHFGENKVQEAGASSARSRTCMRCGKISFHAQKKQCSACGFGRSTKMRSYKWTTKRPKIPTH